MNEKSKIMSMERFTHKYVNYETIYGRNKLRGQIQMTEMLHKSSTAFILISCVQ